MAAPAGAEGSTEEKPSRWGEGRSILERETGFEPATSTLARSHSTTELLPLGPFILVKAYGPVKPAKNNLRGTQPEAVARAYGCGLCS